MKIRLDENEIVAIIKEWAMKTHKTKDVSGAFEIDFTPEIIGPRKKLLHPAKLNNIFVSLDVVVSEGEYDNTISSFANAAIARVQKAYETNIHAGIPQRIELGIPNNPQDFTPNFDTKDAPVA